MGIKRNLRAMGLANGGRLLAKWLNSDPEWKDPAGSQIRLLMILYVSREIGAPPTLFRQAVERAGGSSRPPGLRDFLMKQAMSRVKESVPPKGEIACDLSVARIPLNVSAEFKPRGRGVAFRMVPADERSAMLILFGELCDSGNISRVRYCPNCHRFWFNPGRADKQACSLACKTALWQKTPKGREKRREYMQKWRATSRKLWEAKQRGRALGRGRNLHVSLKKGE